MQAKATLNIAHLPKGIYILKLEVGGEVAIRKWIKD
jgi:hypothetical protein